jgi:hypothetical protein
MGLHAVAEENDDVIDMHTVRVIALSPGDYAIS